MNENAETFTGERSSKSVLAVLDNLFFSAKINQAAERAGVKVNHAKDIERALEIAHAERPSLIIIDLEAATFSPFELIRRLKTEADLVSIQTLGFVSHMNTAVQEQARKAGIDRALARSVFDRDLVTLLSGLK